MASKKKKEINTRDWAWINLKARGVSALYIIFQRHNAFLILPVHLNSDDRSVDLKMDVVSSGIIWNQRRRRDGNITCQSCDRASLYPHITKADILSSVYYTGLQGEIDLKWQLLGPFLWRVKLTWTQSTLQRLVYLNLLCSAVQGVILSLALLSGDIMACADFVLSFYFFTRKERKIEEQEAVF